MSVSPVRMSRQVSGVEIPSLCLSAHSPELDVPSEKVMRVFSQLFHILTLSNSGAAENIPLFEAIITFGPLSEELSEESFPGCSEVSEMLKGMIKTKCAYLGALAPAVNHAIESLQRINPSLKLKFQSELALADSSSCFTPINVSSARGSSSAKESQIFATYLNDLSIGPSSTEGTLKPTVIVPK